MLGMVISMLNFFNIYMNHNNLINTICPVCKSTNALFVGHAKVSAKALKVVRDQYHVVNCLTCETFFVTPPIDLTTDGWRFLYDESYFPQMSKWYEKNRKKDREKRFNKLQLLYKKSITNFLDVGCGEGHCLIEAQNRGWKPHGIDITDHRIAMAKKNLIEFKNSTLTDSNFPDNYFDIIYMDSVLEHVINPIDYLLEIKRILKKGGLLYIGVPNEDSLLNDFKKLYYMLRGNSLSNKLKPFETPYHVVGFNTKSIKYALELVHLEIIELRNFACRLEFMRLKPFSKGFFYTLALFPIYILAVPVRREAYLEIYAQK
jgi:ubiquinone/menaquinone biosynthesis C-methylase UbiE